MVNRATLVGYLGKDMRVNYTRGGTAVGEFSMATSRRWRGKDGQTQEDTQWHRVKVWAKTAEALQNYLLKGKLVLVEGRIETRSYDGRDGSKRWITEIVAENIKLLGGRRSGGDDGSQERSDEDHHSQAPSREPGDEPEEQLTDDDIPF